MKKARLKRLGKVRANPLGIIPPRNPLGIMPPRNPPGIIPPRKPPPAMPPPRPPPPPGGAPIIVPFMIFPFLLLPGRLRNVDTNEDARFLAVETYPLARLRPVGVGEWQPHGGSWLIFYVK
jgi:hypothetical protein